MNTILRDTRTIIKKLLFRTSFKKYFLYRYRYNFNPAHLMFLCEWIDRTKNLPGSIIEIGCAGGHTTVFLNKYLDFLQTNKEYICIDTFSGFTKEDINIETAKRGKIQKDYYEFQENDKKWFDYTMVINNVSRVKTIEADINNFTLSSLGKISYCLIDVDLYRPVRSSLRGIYNSISEGGVIIVDDCVPNNKYDGALQAYMEFISQYNIEENIAFDKFGLIVKNGTTIKQI